MARSRCTCGEEIRWKADELSSDEWLLVPKRDAFVDFNGYAFDCAFCPSCHRLWIDTGEELSCLAPESGRRFEPLSRRRANTGGGPGGFEALFEKIIRQTRYQGTYEGGRWIAYVVNGAPDLPGDAYGEDTPCRTWWQQSDGTEHPRTARIGRGETIHGAVADLSRRWRQAGAPSTFDWFSEPDWRP